MNKRSVRCFKQYAKHKNKYNYEVYCLDIDFGYALKLFSCASCGEIYVIDFENLDFQGKNVDVIAKNISCMKCKSDLGETLKKYPENFFAENGEIGHFVSEYSGPPNDESFFKEFFEIE